MAISRPKIVTSLLLFIIISLAFTLRYSTLKNHVIPSGDEGSFLSLALNISEGKGFTNNVIWHFYNKNESLPYPEDTRHPLYAVFIAGLYHITGVSMRPAQWLNIVFNLLSILLVFLLGKKLHSEKAGLFAAFLMAISWPQIKYSAYVYSEILFEFIVLLVAFFYLQIIIGSRDTKRNHFIIGILLGLSYLCRPNGIFLFAAGVATTWIYNRERLLWVIGGFFCIALWWMGRNVYHFGNPLYGHFNYFMWIDSHHELWYTISDVPPNLRAFMHNHSLLEIIGKFFKGVSGLLSELWKFEGISYPLTKIVFPFFIYFLYKKQYKQIPWVFILSYLLITLLPTIWTASVIWVARYLLLFYPFYFLAVATGLSEIQWKRFSARGVQLIVPTAVIVVLLFQYYPLRFLTSQRNGDIKGYETLEQKHKWITENVPENAIILTGALTQIQYTLQRFMILYPAQETLDSAIEFSRKHGVTHFIIDKQLLYFAPALQEYWNIENEMIIEKQIPSYLKRNFLQDGLGVYTVNRG